MRYQLDHKENTHKQIVSAAGQLFRKEGVVGTGVARLMKEVGLTQGGFYSHFESKEALIRESLVAAMRETVDRHAKALPPDASPADRLRALFDNYLSPRHLQHPERGCAFATIGSELVREPEATREAMSAVIETFVDLIERHLPTGLEDARGLARSVFALLSGTLQLARIATTPREAETVLADGRKAARKLCDIPG